MAYVYTEKEFEEIKQLYLGGATLEAIQAKYSTKSVASIRMKLVKCGVYVAKATGVRVTEKATTTKVASPTTKMQIKQAYRDALNWVGYAPM